MLYGVDSAYPSSNPWQLVNLGWQFVCGYLGPVGGTPHIWTHTEWKRHADVGLKLAPIWVAPYGTPSEQEGVDSGNAALSKMHELGLSNIIVLDVENGASDPEFITGFCNAVHNGDCSVALYGSESTLLNAPGVDAWWLASWVQSGVPLHQAPIDWSMWQYATGPQFDYNVAVDTFTFAGLA
jgi:hypothetical protein